MYQPNQKILEKYADILVNFALGSGKGIKRGDVVRIAVSEIAKPLFVEIYKAVLKSDGYPLVFYFPNDDKNFNLSKMYYDLASSEQLNFFAKKYYKGMVNQIDHTVGIIAETDKHALQDVDPVKIMQKQRSVKPFIDWMNEKENKGKFTWVTALYGTSEMAKEANLSLEEYWQQIIKGCYLDEQDPKKHWQKVMNEINKIKNKLTEMKIDYVKIEGKDVDLKIKIGEKRRWRGGSGRNIPSFEVFTSPDFRETEGWISFNQPLYRFGNLIKDVKLEFKKGKVVKASASKNEKVLKEMLKTKGADKIGEFSLTDGRFSKITKFMAETLYDENVGGPQGNTHIALGASYKDCYNGKAENMKKRDWNKLGFNDSAIHTDIVSTVKRKVTAYLGNGKKKVIYENGKFVL